MGDRASQVLLASRLRELAACALALLLAVCMLAFAPSQRAYGVNEYWDAGVYSKNLWTKYADTSWYSANKDSAVYTITTAEQFAGLSKLVTTQGVDFRGKTVRLGANIDLKGHQWLPIGCDEDNYWDDSPFRGTFDGRGHTISGLYIKNAWHHQALFGKIYDATLKNFTVKGKVTTGWGAAGVVALSERSTLSNITNYADVTTLFKSGDGGFSSTAGGVVAYVVDVYVTQNGAKSSVLTGLRNYGNVEIAGITEQGGGVGGIAGSLIAADDDKAIQVTQCENYGTVHALSSNYPDIYMKGAGGIVGSTATYGNYEVSDCSNVGDVSSDNLASTGGIVGAISGLSSSVSYCYNAGSVNGASPEAVSAAGGIVGRSVAAHTGSTTLSVVSCYNVGKVTGRGANISAILGATSGYGEDWDSTDAGTTVVNDSNYYTEDSVQRSVQGDVLFQKGTVDAAQPVSRDQINSAEVIKNLNATDKSMDHFAEGELSPKLELKAGTDMGLDDSSAEGKGEDAQTTVSQEEPAHQKETHMYAVSPDKADQAFSDVPLNVVLAVVIAVLLLLVAGSVAWQLGYFKSQTRRLKAVPSPQER
ncbi:MAG: hypothetical protein Q4D06_02475 [Coriobacteriia bacterium]|nr:hypothetical protein [Coriobacteriia bacterium]